MHFKRIFVVFMLMALAYEASSQSFFAMRRARKMIASVGVGTATYYGEMTNPGDLMDFKPSVSLGLQMYVSHKIAVRAEATWYHIYGNDADANSDRNIRNLNFRSNNFELNAVGIYNLARIGKRFYQRPTLNIYAFGGFGLTYINPQANYNGEWISLQPLQTEGKSYSLIQPVLPFGAGIKIKQGPFFNICIEGGYRFTFTDYLDDVSSRRYADPASLSSDLSRALADRRAEWYLANKGVVFTPTANVGRRGNPESNDGYFLMTVKVEYYLPYNFASNNEQKKTFRSKRKAFYRYNKRGGLRK